MHSAHPALTPRPSSTQLTYLSWLMPFKLNAFLPHASCLSPTTEASASAAWPALLHPPVDSKQGVATAGLNPVHPLSASCADCVQVRQPDLHQPRRQAALQFLAPYSATV